MCEASNCQGRASHSATSEHWFCFGACSRYYSTGSKVMGLRRRTISSALFHRSYVCKISGTEDLWESEDRFRFSFLVKSVSWHVASFFENITALKRAHDPAAYKARFSSICNSWKSLEASKTHTKPSMNPLPPNLRDNTHGFFHALTWPQCFGLQQSRSFLS